MNLPKPTVITRFAPSPTGELHIGGARTALFNYLYARHMGGQFLLRIDDTDQIRSSQTFTHNILNSLKWLGMTWDNEDKEMYQSNRFEVYQAAVEDLLQKDQAYKCYASEEDSERIRALPTITERKLALRELQGGEGEYVVRFKSALEGLVQFRDEIAGELGVSFSEIDDFVLLRGDRSPTYMLATVVDDAETKITHVIRAAEHLPNTYRQLPLLQAFGYEMPTYVHIPMINGPDGKKLSKRHNADSIYQYQRMGILPEAMVSYMLRLGWSHSGTQEIFSMEEAKQIFSLEGLRASPACFDLDKLLHVNSYYIKNMPEADLLERLDLPDWIVPKVKLCLNNMREKANSLNYIQDMSTRIFSRELPQAQDALPELTEAEWDWMKSLDWTKIYKADPELLKDHLTKTIEEQGLNKRNLFMFMRVALTGMKVSPGLFEIMVALGVDLIQQRMQAAINS